MQLHTAERLTYSAIALLIITGITYVIITVPHIPLSISMGMSIILTALAHLTIQYWIPACQK